MSARAKTVGKEIEGPHKSTRYQVDSVDSGGATIAFMGSPEARLKLPTSFFPIVPRKGHLVKLDIAVEDPYTREEWANAFAEQGHSDLRTYDILSNADAPSCHSLHYLQMATEKIAKAYQVAGSYWPPRKKSHVAAVEFVKNYYSSPSMRARYDRNREQLAVIRDEMVKVAMQVEKLAPAVDEENVPENVEYPWATSEKLEVPCRYKFPIEELPKGQIKGFVQMLKNVVVEVNPTLSFS